jgi:hypothetical protein
MDDLDVLGGRSRGSLARMARTGVTLFGSGFVAGVVIALIFRALIVATVVIAAVVIVLIAIARVALGRRRD